ncbi:MAG: 4Fe-4S dicluster domain-containing protein [Polyangiaceae bacterium]|nr:4Fe-4S dicluster domain-containing protein [Polyangiaceae bacterium]
MTLPALRPGDRALLDVEGLSALIAALRDDGFRVIGPVVRDGAIVYGDVRAAGDLPAGWTDDQAPGRYRLRRRDDGALFGFAVGPQSLRPHLFAPRVTLFKLRRKDESFELAGGPAEPERLAVLGARACDLAAVAVQDRVFLEGAHTDPDYAARRARLFVVAVQCGTAGATCFCVSMGTGPRAERGFDLALTELDARGSGSRSPDERALRPEPQLLDGEHRFLVEIGSDAGARVLERIAPRPAGEADSRAAAEVTARTAASMGRSTPAAEHHDLLARNLEHPRWDDVASRCLGCTNCTIVCPTCFCSTVEDTTDLSGDEAERARRWDSCFTLDHSYLSGGGPARSALRSRYRQWLTHKLGTWIDQYGTSGCVGCGRCITWCPVGIDITEEVDAIRATDGQGSCE